MDPSSNGLYYSSYFNDINLNLSTISTNDLTVTNTITLPAASIADSALSSNICTLNGIQTITNKSISGLTNTITNIPDSALSGTFVTLTGAQTLTNKNLSGATNTFTNINATSVGTSGLVTNSNYDYIRYLDQYLATTSAPTFNSLSITYPNPLYCEQITRASGANGTSINITPNASFNYFFFTPSISSNGSDFLVAANNAQTLTNKTLTSPIISTISNSGTITLPTGTRTLVARDTTDTLTNKTLTSPIISTISNTGTLTLPISTDTLVGRATTDTLTNKTLTSPTLTTAIFSGSASGTFQTSGLIYTTNTTNPPEGGGSASLTTNGGASVSGNLIAGSLYGNNFLTDYHAVCLHNNAVEQALTSGSVAIMTLSTTLFNSGSNTAVNITAGNMYIQCPKTGFYQIYAQAYFTAGSVLSYERLQVQTTTGTPAIATDTILRQQIDRIATDCSMNISFVHYMTSSDRIYCGVQANATTLPRLSTSASVPTRCYLGIHFLGKTI